MLFAQFDFFTIHRCFVPQHDKLLSLIIALNNITSEEHAKLILFTTPSGADLTEKRRITVSMQKRL